MKNLFNQLNRDLLGKSPLLLLLVILVQLITTPAFSQNWIYKTLEEKKSFLMTAVNGNKIYFYSGIKKVGSSQTRVDQMEIFDLHTNEKEVVNLPAGAESFSGATAVLGSKIYFGGGSTNAGITKQVYVYDTLAKTWSLTYLSLDRDNLSATATNGKVFFGGGNSFSMGSVTNVLNIYNTTTGIWTNTYFPSFGGRDMTAVSIGNKAIFAGGLSNSAYNRRDNVYFYNTETSQWLPTAKLSQPKSNLSSVVYKNKVYFIGGTAWNETTNAVFPSDTIDVYDDASQTWSVIKIPRLMNKDVAGNKRAYTRSAVAGCKMFLLPDKITFNIPDSVAVYDFARGKWSYLALPHPRTNLEIAASGNKIYFVGGQSYTNASNYSDDIDILTLEPKLQLAVANAPVTAYNFGTVETNDLSTVNVALSNEGDYDLLFKDFTQRFSISGDVDDFSIDPAMLQLTDTLEPAEIITLPVSFHPTTIGVKQIIITINSNDPNTPAYTLTVTGTATDIPTSVLNPSEQNIAVYPNPTTGMLHIDTKQQSTLNIQVINLQGQTVKKQTLTDETGLDISALPNGFYIVKIEGDTSSAVVKVLKQ